MNDKYTGQGWKGNFEQNINKRLITYVSQYTDVGAVLRKENFFSRVTKVMPQNYFDDCISGKNSHILPNSETF